MSTRRERAAERRAAIRRLQANRRPDVPLAPAAPGARRVDIGGWDRLVLLVGSLLVLGLGGAAELAAVTGSTYPPHSTPIRIVLAIIGLPFVAGGAAMVVWRLRYPSIAVLDVDAAGLALHDRKGISWRLDWSELGPLCVIRTRRRAHGYDGYFGWSMRVAPPRHVLLLRVPPSYLDRPELCRGTELRHGAWLDVPLDLGLPARTAHRVIEALGPRCVPPYVRREEPGELAEVPGG